MVNIKLTKLLNLKDLIDEYDFYKYEPVSLSIGNDDNVYILFSKNRFRSLDRDYKAVKLQVEWSTGQLINGTVLNFNQLDKGILFIQPIGGDYLFVNPRSRYYNTSTFDKNALIADENGNIKSRMCLGDGINQCLVDKRNRIITGYFDEGVLGNHGWTNPIGRSGLVLWSENGDKLWENKSVNILDCYAINVDSKNHLWFYYYTKFNLVQTDYGNETEYLSPISSANGFLIGKRAGTVLFLNGILDKNYDPQTVDNYKGNYLVSLSWDGLTYNEECRLVNDDNKEIEIQLAGLRNSKGVFIDKQNTIFYLDIEYEQ